MAYLLSASTLAFAGPAASILLPTRPMMMSAAAAPLDQKMSAGNGDSEECELIGEEVATGTEWWSCEEPKAAAPGAQCEEQDFGTGGGMGLLPDTDKGQVLCKVERPRFFGLKMPWQK